MRGAQRSAEGYIRRKPGNSERVIDGQQTKTQLISPYAHNSDLGDAWEYMDYPCYPEKSSGQAYRMGINFMIYAMTH